MRNLFVLPLLALLSFQTYAQKWTTMISEPGHNFYEIRSAFNAYWKDKDKNVKGNGYKQFRRWENFMAPRVYPSGDLSVVSQCWKNFEEFTRNNPSQKLQQSSTWTAMGPFGAMSGVASNGFPRKAGRHNFITFHPTTSGTYWVGAPAGGLWKTVNNGAGWSTNTDNLAVIGCSDLAIDPSNPNIMYLATGDGDNSDTYSIGVLKSTDGGVTWNPTGLTFPVAQQVVMRRLIINPVNPQILLAATTSGIYRSVNAGSTWSLVISFNAYDVEFKPGNPNTVYAGGSNFYLSNNGGTSFTYISSGINTSGANRLNIAVTPADTNYVYVLGSNYSNNGLFGVFRSVNSGVSFSLMASSPDILANSCTSPSGGGQGWYDLSFAASPLNKNEVVAGGVNVWRSLNGGTSFSIIGCWIGTGSPPYVHADHHELEYDATGILYSCNDGGIFKYTGSTWTDLTSPMNIAQIYKIGLSWKSPDMWITGHQDNGSNIYSSGNYMAKMAGDGMDCFIDRTNNSNVFASYYNGNFQRSTDGGASWSSATSGLGGGGEWVSPWKQDPWIANRLYAGLANLYVSNNLGASWSSLPSPGGSGYIIEFAIAPSNNQVIYIIKGNTVRKSVNGGNTWSNISTGLPISSADASFITINPSNANMAWVTFSGYSAGYKVFQTINGGTSWTNVTSNLPNLPANCSVYQFGSDDRIYVGMDVGVYYRDNGSSTWTLYNTGLPNAPISDMEISPMAPTKLRAATYGRGVYEVDVVAPSSAPVSDFTQTGKICEGVPALFTDQSFQSPTAWSWSVAPATGVNIGSQGSPTPSISFPAPGSYTISLVASNAFGAGSTAVRVLTVSPGPHLSFMNDSITACKDEMISLQVTGALNYTWNPGNIEDSLLSFTATYPQPGYTVTGIVANGCTNSRAVVLNVSECLGLDNPSGTDNKIFVYPNPVSTSAEIIAWRGNADFFTAEIYDVSGKQLVVQDGTFKKGNNHVKLDLSNLPEGIYTIRVKPSMGEAQTSKIIKE